MLQFDYGDEASQEDVNKLMPKKVKKRRKITTDDGVCIFNLVPILFVGCV